MLIHLVYEEDYVEQLKEILESAGHSVTEWDYSLSQFVDFSERKKFSAEIALVDGQAGVMSKREIIESLSKVRKNLPNLRLVVIFPISLEKNETFIAKLLTLSIYDMYFRDEYDIDDLESWIANPKNYGNYNIQTGDIRGALTETKRSKPLLAPVSPSTPIHSVSAGKVGFFKIPGRLVEKMNQVKRIIPEMRQIKRFQERASPPKKNKQLVLPEIGLPTSRAATVFPPEIAKKLVYDNPTQTVIAVLGIWPGVGVTTIALNLIKKNSIFINLSDNRCEPDKFQRFKVYNLTPDGWESELNTIIQTRKASEVLLDLGAFESAKEKGLLTKKLTERNGKIVYVMSNEPYSLGLALKQLLYLPRKQVILAITKAKSSGLSPGLISSALKTPLGITTLYDTEYQNNFGLHLPHHWNTP